MTNTMDKANAAEGIGSVSAEALEPMKAGDTVAYYILKQIEAIINETKYLHEAVDTLSKMSDGDSGQMGSPGNCLGQAKANALGDVVRSREATNQQILEFYKMLYTDLRSQA